MPIKSLIGELPRIVSDGNREAAAILDRLSSPNRITLQTNEIVLPAKASSAMKFGNMGILHVEQAGSLCSQMNRLIYGDNLLAMQALLAGDPQTGLESLRGKVDLIYIDPPFDSKADYRTKLTLPGGDINQKPTTIEQFAYADTWKDGTVSYLRMLYPRLVLMRELLSDHGSIYVHIDWHVGHYVKVLMDEVFGKENFRNEIVWQYSGWNKKLKCSFEKRHDVLLFYSMNEDCTFNSYFEQWASEEEYIKRRKQKPFTDEIGRRYVLSDGGNGTRVRRYLDEAIKEGVVVDDVWNLDKLNNSAKECVGYATQKPEKQLDRIIKASSNVGDLVCDFFGGSGTTAAVAERLGRR